LAQLLNLNFFFLSGGCGLFHSFILPDAATEVFFDLNSYGSTFVESRSISSTQWSTTSTNLAGVSEPVPVRFMDWSQSR
jgi:hypothetical protein